ncbi:MAG TPA: hypothetical protein VNJ01_11805 [Bacteriovoracaceae bacterium]|nr:hypothetical protein [Bacteriovoracaceae bacterium]
MKQLTRNLLLGLGLITLISCGVESEDNSETTTPGPAPTPQQETVPDFSTRLNNNFLVSGLKCNGGETTESNGTIFTCQRNQWLIKLDDINVCRDDGACTEADVIPFVAQLDQQDIIAAPEYTFFEIKPVSPVTNQQAARADDVWVRFDLNSDTAEVVPR